MTIKSVARRNWPDPDRSDYATWYEPFTDRERIGQRCPGCSPTRR